MIPVIPAPEPGGFNANVRVPGQLFLATNQQPTGNQWRNHDYWRAALTDLHHAYSGICNYCSSFTPRSASGTSEGSSVDHFVPKSAAPLQAYDWDNFRLCRPRLNNRKDSHQDVLDPFTLPSDWFHLNFQTFLILPNPTLAQTDQALVVATIDRLQLNVDSDYVNERIRVVQSYCAGAATFNQVHRRYPFIAAEMTRQNFDATFLPRMARLYRGTL